MKYPSRILILGFLFVAPLFAAPTLIRDNRVKDIGLTPVLGRGYSMATNTFQGTCLGELKTTTASFDFDYKFMDIDTKDDISEKGEGVAESAEAFDFLRRVTKKSQTIINKRKYFYHYVVVVLTVDSYYSSVDEGTSAMSQDARSLLESKDLLGFFESCGPYYVRSIVRRSQYFNVFEYTTLDEKKDEGFENILELTIRRFSGKRKKRKKEEETDAKDDLKYKFDQQAVERNLKIYSRAIGLGKSQGDSLLPTDLDTFKTTLNGAFISTQDELTGRIVSMEVVPWVENPMFQSLLNANYAESDTGAGNGNEVNLFEKKLIMNENAEFFMEITRTDRSLLNNYHKSKVCRATIDQSFKSGGELREEYKNDGAINHKTGATIPLEQLDRALSPAVISALYREREEFMFGKKEAPSGSVSAVACLTEIMKRGITKKTYREIAVCQGLQKNMKPVILNPIIDDYCMPVLSSEEPGGLNNPGNNVPGR